MKSATGAAAQRRGHRQHYRVRVLSAIGAAVPIRLLKRDLQFLLNQIAPLLDDWRLQTLARQHGIRKDRETDGIGKLFAAFVRRSHEGTLSRLLVEAAVLLAAARTNPAVVLREAAATYKIDTDAIALRVKQEFAAKVLSRSMRIGRLHFSTPCPSRLRCHQLPLEAAPCPQTRWAGL